MKFGVCTDITQLRKSSLTEFDYIECALNRIAELHSDDLKLYRNILSDYPVAIEVCNNLFPVGYKIIGPHMNESKMTGYLHFVFKRAVLLGAKIIVFSDGYARKCPEGWPLDLAKAQFEYCLHNMAETAAQYNLTIVLEPLCSKETNIINSLADGSALVRELNIPNLGVMADFYQMRMESESMSVLSLAGTFLKHVHIANSNGRVFPNDENEDNYESFFSALKKVKYDQRISIEASTNNFERDTLAALKIMKTLANQDIAD
jgi:D-psicose/D-tagatose/L-ribulose 3-epimerase